MQAILDWPYWGQVLRSIRTTLEITFLSFAMALVLGLVVASARVSTIAPLRWAGAAYITILRNIPSLGLIFIAVFVLPDVGLLIPVYWAGVLTLGFYESAYVAESIRTGINTIDIGTTEAARSLGCRSTQTLLYVVLPQAARNVVQPLGNVFIKTMIGSSLVAVIGVDDLTGVAQKVNLAEAEPILFVLAGACYVILALLAGRGIAYLERRLRYER